jgi:hypothetical protein
MKYATKAMMHQLIGSLRGLAPRRALSYGEAIQIARWQAARVRACEWINGNQLDINLIWLRQQREVPVNFVPSHVLLDHRGLPTSGLTTDEISGRLEIYVNDQEPHVRQRFTLLHEFKHALDFDHAEFLYGRLGSGKAERREWQVEAICNEFAANVLMPTVLVKRAWFRTQNLSLCAGLFNVSPEAMNKRLTVLGLIGEPKPAPRIYFRSVGRIQDWDVTELAAFAA